MLEYITGTCKMGQGKDCCRYLICGPKGFECAKADPHMKRVLDLRVTQGRMVSQGDNCEGVAGLLDRHGEGGTE